MGRFSRSSSHTASSSQRELTELVNLPENNNKCGECNGSFPTWASTNLGIFLCGRCASVHRNILGNRDDFAFSNIKSLAIDRWNSRDIDTLADSGGNKRNNNFWNPKREPFPFDGDEDKTRVEEYIRNKYIIGSYRYDPIQPSDFGDRRDNQDRDRRDNRRRDDRADSRGGIRDRGYDNDDYDERYRRGSGRDRAGSSNDRWSNRERSSGNVTLTNRKARDFELSKYSRHIRNLKEMGYSDVDNNAEALSIAHGDINKAIDILENNNRGSGPNRTSSNEPVPSLPKRRPTVSGPTPAVFDGSDTPASAGVQPTPAVFDGTVQQYMDPVTGMVYVDQQQYAAALQNSQQQALQQQALQQQALQQQALQQQALQQQAMQQAQMTGMYTPQQQQPSIDKNTLMGLYNRPDLYSSPVEIKPDHPQFQQLQQAQAQVQAQAQAQAQAQLQQQQLQQQQMGYPQQQPQQQQQYQPGYPGYFMQ